MKTTNPPYTQAKKTYLFNQATAVLNAKTFPHKSPQTAALVLLTAAILTGSVTDEVITERLNTCHEVGAL